MFASCQSASGLYTIFLLLEAPACAAAWLLARRPKNGKVPQSQCKHTGCSVTRIMFPEVGQPLVAMRAVPWQHEREQRAPRRRGAGRRGWKGKEETLEGLLALGPHPSQRAVFDACRPGGFWKANPRAATTILTALAKRGLWDVSTKVFRFMKDLQMEINQFHFSSIISACEKRPRSGLAVLFSDAPRQKKNTCGHSQWPAFSFYLGAASGRWPSRCWMPWRRSPSPPPSSPSTPPSAPVRRVAARRWHWTCCGPWKHPARRILVMCPKADLLTLPSSQLYFAVPKFPVVLKDWPVIACQDCISYNAAVSACATASLWKNALGILQEMRPSTSPDTRKPR